MVLPSRSRRVDRLLLLDYFFTGELRNLLVREILLVDDEATIRPALGDARSSLGYALTPGPPVDVYPLDAVAYVWLAGEAIFSEVTPMQLYERQLSARARGVRRTKVFSKLIFAYLKKRPADPPKHMADIATVLSAILFVETWDATDASALWRKHSVRLARLCQAPFERIGDKTVNLKAPRSKRASQATRSTR